MTFDRWLLLGTCGALIIAIYLTGFVVRDCPRWFLGCTCRDPEPLEYLPLEADYDEWERLDPDQAAATLIAEWHTDLPGPAPSMPAPRAGGLHPRHERTITADVWDEWWAGLDGLDRELLACRASREREERLWAELLAETRELCPA